MNQIENQHPQTVVYIVQDNKESVGVAAVSGFFVSLLCVPCSSFCLFGCFKKERSRGAILLATALGTLVYIIVLWILFAQIFWWTTDDAPKSNDGLSEGLATIFSIGYGIPAGIYSILFFVFLAFGYRMFRRVDEVDEDSTLPVMK
jgi:hypothetical protein